MRRRGRDNTLNLFAFQDIITGVAGVMLFVLLLLVVHMTVRTAAASSEMLQAVATNQPPEPPPPPEPEPEVPDRETLEQMRRQLEELRRQSAQLLATDRDELDAKIREAEAELDRLMEQAAQQKAAAASIASQMSSDETSQQKASTLSRRDAFRRQIEMLEQEEQQHASGKLVAFSAKNSGMKELWIIDMRGSRASIFNVESPGDAVSVSYEPLAPPYKIVQSVKTALSEQTKVRSVVVLLRPTIAGVGSEILDAFRHSGYKVALEILDEETRVAPSSSREKP